MDCREFREQHVSFVDLRCSAVEEAQMRQHLRDCVACSRHDTVVRRSLMLVKSLPTIEPSPDFQARLEARLRAVAVPAAASPSLRGSYAAFVALAAGVGFVAFLATSAMRDGAPSEIRMAPVVASIPEYESPVATPAFVATVPTGMSVWPAIMVASQAPIHFVAAEMATER
jgi:hypothetical protein